MNTAKQSIIVIPARYASSRFPGKPLHLLLGKPMIQHVWERCMRCRSAASVVIATDDERIREAAAGFGAEVVMTSPAHASGTDRIAEVAAGFEEAEYVVNVQGDEPLIEPTLVDRLLESLIKRPDADMVTAAVPVEDAVRAADPNVVKVVAGSDGMALYFSRSPIPYARHLGTPSPHFLWHKGIYGYRRAFLERFVTWPASPLEESEQLEQLRALENGGKILVIETSETSPGVDTPSQALEVERILREAQE